jgi:hypothetical protein
MRIAAASWSWTRAWKLLQDGVDTFNPIEEGIMLKLFTVSMAVALGVGLNVATAQNVDSDKSTAQGQDKTMQDKGQSANPSAAGEPRDCAKLSGKERDQCIQATPAGPLDVQTGQENERKSATAKERDQSATDTQPGNDAPAQSNSSIGKPDQKSPTGQAQTGAGGQKGQPQAAPSVPDQTKDTVGHPKGRTTTGEAQSGQEPGQTTSTEREKKDQRGPVQN